MIGFLILKIPPQKTTETYDLMRLDYNEQLSTIKKLADKDPKIAWELVKKTFIQNGEVVGNAHGLSHIVGHGIYNKYGIDGIKICDSAFSFGCFHGVTEAMLEKVGVEKIKMIEESCLRVFPPNKTQNYTGCIHGTGHGIYEREGGDMKKSLSDCDIISESYRQYCYDGVFMQNSFSEDSRVIDENNPWKLCSDLDPKYHRNCARYQSQIFLGKIGQSNPLDKVGKYCASGPSVLLRETCFESLGYYVSQNRLGNAEKVWRDCSLMPDRDGAEICTTGGAIEAVFQRYSGYEKNSQELCGRIVEPRKTSCLNSVQNILNGFKN